jgi:TrmH family RNA methyltransferase
LAEALKDINIAVGTTCATHRACQAQSIIDLSAQLKNNAESRIAIVFGEERDGLKTEDLERCNFIASIPSNPDFPSLNLAQAVGIFAYELSRPSSSNTVGNSPNEEEQTNGTDTEIFLKHLETFLHDIQFTKQFSEKKINSELRVLFNRARPSARELKLLHAILKKLDGSQN